MHDPAVDRRKDIQQLSLYAETELEMLRKEFETAKDNNDKKYAQMRAAARKWMNKCRVCSKPHQHAWSREMC